MANPLPDLRGWAAKGDPDWQQKAMARVGEAQKARNKRRRVRQANVQVFYDPPFAGLLKRAAMARGINIAGYVRRAVGARIAADLGLEFSEVMRHCAAPAAYGERYASPERRVKSHDDGEGFGPW